MAISLRERLLGRFATLTNRFRVWYQLPFLLAMPTLVGQRVNMREHNLSDTERDPSLLKPQGGPSPRDQRAADGSYNDLGCPSSRFRAYINDLVAAVLPRSNATPPFSRF